MLNYFSFGIDIQALRDILYTWGKLYKKNLFYIEFFVIRIISSIYHFECKSTIIVNRNNIIHNITLVYPFSFCLEKHDSHLHKRC